MGKILHWDGVQGDMNDMNGGQRFRRLCGAVALAAAAALFSAMNASAAIVALDSTGFTLRIADVSGAADSMTISQSSDQVTVTDTAGVSSSSAGCTAASPNQIVCTSLKTLGSIDVDLGGGDDTLIHDVRQSGLVFGGSGNDRIDASPSFDLDAVSKFIIHGDLGDDTLIGAKTNNEFNRVGYFTQGPSTVGAGNDTVVGGPSIDQIYVGEGSDFVNAGAGNDEISNIKYEYQGLTDANDDRAPDSVICGDGLDDTTIGAADAVKADCEQLTAVVICNDTRIERRMTCTSGRGQVLAGPGRAARVLGRGARIGPFGFGRGQFLAFGFAHVSPDAGLLSKALAGSSVVNAMFQLPLKRKRKHGEPKRITRRIRFQIVG